MCVWVRIVNKLINVYLLSKFALEADNRLSRPRGYGRWSMAMAMVMAMFCFLSPFPASYFLLPTSGHACLSRLAPSVSLCECVRLLCPCICVTNRVNRVDNVPQVCWTHTQRQRLRMPLLNGERRLLCRFQTHNLLPKYPSGNSNPAFVLALWLCLSFVCVCVCRSVSD